MEALREELRNVKAFTSQTLIATPVANPVPITKSEKLPNPPMFNRNRNDLRPFITKLHLKLLTNHNWYPTKASKVSYGMSCLSKDAV